MLNIDRINRELRRLWDGRWAHPDRLFQRLTCGFFPAAMGNGVDIDAGNRHRQDAGLLQMRLQSAFAHTRGVRMQSPMPESDVHKINDLPEVRNAI